MSIRHQYIYIYIYSVSCNGTGQIFILIIQRVSNCPAVVWWPTTAEFCCRNLLLGKRWQVACYV